MKALRRTFIMGLSALVALATADLQAAAPRGSQKFPGAKSSYSTTSRVSARPASMLAEPQPVPEPVPGPDPDEVEHVDSSADAELWDDANDCSTCGVGSRGCLGGLWYGSVDYLLFRPRLSQGVAEVRRFSTSDTSTFPGTTTLSDTVIAYPFSYQSGFRAALGYRLLDCGGDIQVAYWRMANTASVSDGPASTSDSNPFIAGNLGNNPGSNEFLLSSTTITANIFDVDFAKTISMGGPIDPCETCFCPRWDLKFSAGARIADITRTNDNVVTNNSGDALSTGNINARFTGAGPRVGLQGRRYFGQRGLTSLYAKASQALLIGDYRMGRQLNVPSDGTTANQITNQFDRFSRMVPVTDIEVGGTWQVAPFTYISAGYFFQCWWDLGQGENIQGTNFGALDSSNILGFDGLFIRGEMLF